MPRVLVIGGGLAGLSAAAALGESGFHVDLLEARAFLGGRATSYTLPDQETIDNCQHILLRCCVNLLDFYRRMKVADKIRFHRRITFIEPGGRSSTLKGGLLPAPFHFTGSFARLRFLDPADKLAVARGLMAIRLSRRNNSKLERITMLDWLRRKRQTERAIERFWRPVLVSAINEELDRIAASHGFQVFRLGFLARRDAYEMGVPEVPLGLLYDSPAWNTMPDVHVHFRTTAERIQSAAKQAVGVDTADGARWKADYYVSAVPFERVGALAPQIKLDLARFEYSSITGIHLWFDRKVTGLPHAALLDRTIQWFFNKQDGRYLQLVVSASKGLLEMPRGEIVALAVRELGEFLPSVREAKVLKSHVVKEVRATFSALPGLESARPFSRTSLDNLFLAGDWTRSGWPATMEGAVRSGYLAAEAVSAAAGKPARFLLPDIA